jgi:hypothetical protein
MASFPGAKIHRNSKTRLSRGQSFQQLPTQITLSATGMTVTITFSLPCVVRGNIDLNLSGGQTLVSQTVVNQFQIQQVYSAAVTGDTYSIPANIAEISTFQGGGNAAASGTF